MPPPVRHCPAHIIIGRAIQWKMSHATRDSSFSFTLASQKESSPSDSPLSPHPVIARLVPGNPVKYLSRYA
ncbi:hypothetical protein [Candidatus Spongiihabitans sp.]|uniref:hypothetical protein n=1 Tax=Candidatus Spongiihabitans sp. TaxID=3101308 RepID=UPI003C7EB2CB